MVTRNVVKITKNIDGFTEDTCKAANNKRNLTNNEKSYAKGGNLLAN